MNISLTGLLGLIGCLLIAVLPLPRRAEGLRIGFFGAVMGFVFFDATRRRDRGEAAHKEPETEAASEPELVPVQMADLSSDDEDKRVSPVELLTGFSVLNHLRRTGAVSRDEFEQKKVDILRRV